MHPQQIPARASPAARPPAQKADLKGKGRAAVQQEEDEVREDGAHASASAVY